MKDRVVVVDGETGTLVFTALWHPCDGALRQARA